MRWTGVFFLAVFCFTFAWGGESGPQPAPVRGTSLVRALQASRKGNRVALSWSQPRQILDAQSPLPHPLVTRLCRDISSTRAKPRSASSAPVCAEPLGEIDPRRPSIPHMLTVSSKSDNEIAVRFVDTLPKDSEGADPPRSAFYRVELRDERGRSVGFSEPAVVSLAPVLPAKGLHSELDARGVYLIWENEIEDRPSSLQFGYRVYRREKTGSRKFAIPYLQAVVHTSEGERWTAVDTNIEWDTKYLYWITPVTKVYSDRGVFLTEILGEDSAPLEVNTHNVFPPAVPERLLVLVSHGPGKKFIDLTWAPNGEKDLEGYNVYRREEGGAAGRINSKPLATLSFQDLDVVPGHRYFYSISAIDVRGNESAKSAELAELVR